jgi:hypothetical protein
VLRVQCGPRPHRAPLVTAHSTALSPPTQRHLETQQRCNPRWRRHVSRQVGRDCGPTTLTPLGNKIVLGNWEFRNTVCEMLVEAPAARRRSWDCRCGGKVATARRLDMLATISTGGTRSLSPETSIATRSEAPSLLYLTSE